MQKGLINKHSFSELALLVIFAGGLFWANLIVKSRSQIRLGQGCELPGAGLTVYWPAEKGWQGLTQWQLEQKNCLVLPARLTHPSVDVQWVYGFSTTAASNEDLLDQLGAEFGGTIADKGVSAGTMPMQIGRLVNEKNRGDCYLGAIVLDFGRTLTLRVQSEGDFFYAYDVFHALANSVQYTRPAALSEGVELIQELRQAGAATLFSDRQDQNLLIVDTAGSVRGYEITQINPNSNKGVRIDKTLVMNTAAVQRKEFIFESGDLFDEFHWQNGFSNSTGQSGVFQMHLKDNSLTVQDPMAQVQTIVPSPMMVCEVLLEDVAGFFIGRSQQTAVLDILNSDGRIIPSKIQLISVSDAANPPEGTAYTVRVEAAGGAASEIYFDADKKLLGKIVALSRGRILIWKPALRQDIEKIFDTRPVRKGPVVRVDSFCNSFAG